MEPKPHPHTPAQFAPDTSAEEAGRLMAAAFQAIAQGWPVIYFKTAALEGAAPTINLDAMVTDAGALAVQMQREIDRRQSPSDL